MTVILYLLGASLLLGGGGLALFLWSLRTGQYRGPGRRGEPDPVRRRIALGDAHVWRRRSSFSQGCRRRTYRIACRPAPTRRRRTYRIAYRQAPTPPRTPDRIACR